MQVTAERGRGWHARSMYEVDEWSALTRGLAEQAAVDGRSGAGIADRGRCRGLLLAVDGLTRGEVGRKLRDAWSSVARGMSASSAACCTTLGCLTA